MWTNVIILHEPKINYTTKKTNYKRICMPHELTVHNHETGVNQSLASFPPTSVQRTLGVFISPNGDGRTQINHTILKAKELLGKMRKATIPQKTKWIAVNSVIEQALFYPLINTHYTESEVRPIESVISQLKCSALCLNRNFPRALSYGSTKLGGLGIPAPTHKVTKDRINYYLWNKRQCTNLEKKFNVSISYTQLEVGTFEQFDSIAFTQYGHLAMTIMCIQIWRETEPKVLILKPSSDVTWIPPLTDPTDRSLMELATNHFYASESYMINRCRLYLQVIFIHDLLLFGRPLTHPAYTEGYRPPSRISKIIWPCFPRPSRNYWIIWTRFVHQYIQPHVPQYNR
jgi:hypothetical protein